MFTVPSSHKVKWPVTIRKPIDGGNFEKHKLDVVFEILPTDEYEQSADKGDIPFLERILIGIDSDVLSENGSAPLAFEQAKAALLRIPYARVALIEAYYMAASGQGAQK